MDHTVFTCKPYHACLLFISVHQMAPSLTEVADIRLQLTTHSSTLKGWKVSWPSWLTYSGWFTHISGHPSATGRAQDSEVHWPKTDAPPLCHATNQPFFGHSFKCHILSCHQVTQLITGSIARSANLPVFSLLRGQFWGFSPRRGDTLHRWGWNLAWRMGPSVPSSMPNFTPIGATTRV